MAQGNKTFANIATAVVVLAVLWWIFAPGGGDSEAEPDPQTIAEERLEDMDASWPSQLRLDYAGVEDVVDYMGRSADDMEMNRSSGERRLYYEFEDDSALVFVMQPAVDGGLVLEYVTDD